VIELQEIAHQFFEVQAANLEEATAVQALTSPARLTPLQMSPGYQPRDGEQDMQVSVQLDHKTTTVEFPEGKTWANVRKWHVETRFPYALNFEFDDGTTLENREYCRGDYSFDCPRKISISDGSGNLLDQKEPPVILRDAFIAVVTAIGGTTAELEYRGSGDEGYIESITVEDKDGKVILNNGEWDRETRTKKVIGDQAVIDRLDELGNEVLNIFVAGFENNEGGQGTIKVDVAARKLTLDHEQNILSTEDETFEV
jgi:hypothetical protein